MGRVDYYQDPNAPRANSLVPAASAVVVDDAGRLILQRRSDNDLWALPGGAMEIGESVAGTVVREVREETGLDVRPEYVIGVYTDPDHVFAYDDGEVRQEYSVHCLHGCRRVAADQRRVDRTGQLHAGGSRGPAVASTYSGTHPRLLSCVKDFGQFPVVLLVRLLCGSGTR
jgi:ADP-ribose pyrophosphatase YjhB (NUDIX family)